MTRWFKHDGNGSVVRVDGLGDATVFSGAVPDGAKVPSFDRLAFRDPDVDWTEIGEADAGRAVRAFRLK